MADMLWVEYLNNTEARRRKAQDQGLVEMGMEQMKGELRMLKRGIESLGRVVADCT
jgi:hypothetical protein